MLQAVLAGNAEKGIPITEEILLPLFKGCCVIDGHPEFERADDHLQCEVHSKKTWFSLS